MLTIQFSHNHGNISFFCVKQHFVRVGTWAKWWEKLAELDITECTLLSTHITLLPLRLTRGTGDVTLYRYK